MLLVRRIPSTEYNFYEILSTISFQLHLGTELLDSLLQVSDSVDDTNNDAGKRWRILRERILRNIGSPRDVNVENDPDTIEDEPDIIDENILYYLTGYVATKGIAFANCEFCKQTLQKSTDEKDSEVAELLRCRDFFNALVTPSEKLFHLTKTIEKKINFIINSHDGLHSGTFLKSPKVYYLRSYQ